MILIFKNQKSLICSGTVLFAENQSFSFLAIGSPKYLTLRNQICDKHPPKNYWQSLQVVYRKFQLFFHCRYYQMLCL